MIKINLLGDDAAADSSGKVWAFSYLASLVLAALALFWVNREVSSEAADLRVQADDLKIKYEALTEKTKEVTELKEKRNTLNNKLAVIARLKRSKLGPVRMLDDLNRALPQGVWLRELSEKDGAMRIKGRALGDQELVIFLENLKRSPYFTTVDLVETQQMYYAKRTGQVQAEPDVTRLTGGNRATKEGAIKPGAAGAQQWGQGAVREGVKRKWGIVGGAAGRTSRGSAFDDYNVKIKEFVVSARINYAGKLPTAPEEPAGTPAVKGGGPK